MGVIIDDLLILIELWRVGRAKEVARRLGMNETTVSRRLSRLEATLGTRVVDRDPRGWRLTEEGMRLLPYAQDVERAGLALREGIPRRPDSVGGTVRIIAPDGFGVFVLTPRLRALRQAHPLVNVELLTVTASDALNARDFDLGITLERPSASSAVVSHLSDYRLQLYASTGYLERHGLPGSIEELIGEHTLIWYIEAVLDVKPLQLLENLLPGAHAAIQSNNISAHLAAVRSGTGIAPLPTYVGEAHDDLVPVLAGEFDVGRSYWLTIPTSVFHLKHVAVVRGLLEQTMQAHPHLAVR